MNTIVPFTEALADKRLVSTFNGNRHDKTIKWRSEEQYALQLIQRSEELQGCTPESVRLAMLEVAYTGLTLAPSLGFAYLIRYGNEAHFSPGYKGILHLFYRANTLESIQPFVVKAQDVLTLKGTADGLDFNLVMKSDAKRSERATTHVIVVAKFKRGGRHVEIVDRAALDAIEAASRTRNPRGGMVWRSKFRSQMEIKAAIRRAAKYWPTDLGGETEHALKVMDKFDGLDFTKTDRDDEAQELLIDEDGILTLHAALTDRGLPSEEADRWISMKAQAMGYTAIEDLPNRLFRQAKNDLLTRFEAVKAAKK